MKSVKSLMVLATALLVSSSAYAVQSYVSGSSNHTTYVLGTDKAIYATGNGRTGVVGPSTNSPNVTIPTAVGLTDVVSIATSYNLSMALKSDSTVWVWGTVRGKVVNTPTKVNFAKPVVDISASYAAAYFVLSDGTMYEWKYDFNVPPALMPNVSNIKSVSSHLYHNVALGKDGAVWVWGKNANGQLGTGTTQDVLTPTKLIIMGIGNKDVRACYQHTMVITPTNSVKSFGNNTYGKLGDGSTTNKSFPVNVANLDNVVGISCGMAYSAAIRNDGSVYMWGFHDYIDTLKNTIYNANKTATKIAVMQGTKFISTAWDQTHFVGQTGKVTTWGGNLYGKLGDGTNIERHGPVATQTALLIPADTSGVILPKHDKACNVDDANKGHGNDCDHDDQDNPGNKK